MKFFKDKVQKYQEKKLSEAKQKLQSYIDKKNQLEMELKSANHEESLEKKKNIENQKKFIEIWKKNITEINKQLRKLKS